MSHSGKKSSNAFLSESQSRDSEISYRIDNNPFSINSGRVVTEIKPSDFQKKHNEYLERIATRSIKFSKIFKEIIIDSDTQKTGLASSTKSDISSEFSDLTYSNTQSCKESCKEICKAQVYIDSIEFTEGGTGTLNYAGNVDTKPDLSKSDFSIRIPCKISAFIVKTTVISASAVVKAHWLIDLKTRTALPLSFLKNGSNPNISGYFRNTSATIMACNTHVMPCQYLKNNSNLYQSITDTDSYVSPYIVYLFSSNIC